MFDLILLWLFFLSGYAIGYSRGANDTSSKVDAWTDGIISNLRSITKDYSQMYRIQLEETKGSQKGLRKVQKELKKLRAEREVILDDPQDQ